LKRFFKKIYPFKPWLTLDMLFTIYIYRNLTIAKQYGIKKRCYSEHLKEHIENLMETQWAKTKNAPPFLPHSSKSSL
jgi:hypothetical protein